ncbi:MAG: hypothetical protein GY838_03725 [bacterium]|nr:hypothetical protein [bacterium]
MSAYTFLIVTRNHRRGKISAVQPGAGEWGTKEVPPQFLQVPFTGTLAEKNWVFRNCAYDLEAKTFVHKDTREAFDKDFDVVEHQEDYTDYGVKDIELAELLTDIRTDNPCLVLKAPDTDIYDSDERSYWVKQYFPFRKRPGVKKLIQAAKYGGYAHCRKAFRALQKQTRRDILATMTEADRKYLRWLYVANNSDEAARMM